MKRKNLTRSALFTSVISLLLCVSMLVGTTFAWFTDEVTSAGNIIKSGTLDVELYWADGTKAVPTDAAGWTDASKGAIFNYTLWEPGYTEVRHIKIANEGTLALKYQLMIRANGEVSKLADVIDVYFTDPAAQIADRTALVSATPVGTLSEVLATMPKSTSGTLLAGKEATVTLALKMQESAGNEYQDLAIGTNFSVVLVATQLEAENDSFDNTYDEDAWGEGFAVVTEQDLNAAIANGETAIDLMADIALTETLEIPAGTAVKLNLSGYELSGNKTKDSGAAIVNNGTLSIYGGEMSNNAVNGAAVIENNGSLTLDGVTVKDAPMDSTGYPEYAVVTYGKLTVEEGTAIVADRGAIRTYAGAEVVINGGSFTVSNAADGRNMTFHTIYAYGNGAKLTINDGYFEQNHTSTGGASVICPAGASIDIYGGDFRDAMDDTDWQNTGNFQNYMGYSAPVNVYGGTFDDTTVNKNLASGYKAVKTPNGWMVISSDNEYVADGVLKSTDSKNYFISSAAGYAWMDQQADNFFAGKTITLDASIDFGGATINAISFWNPESKTTFDGNGKTLSNFVITNDGDAGLFNGTYDVKNLIVDNANVTGKYAAVIAGNMYGNIDNVTVKNSVVNGTYWQTGALAGQYNAGNITKCVVDDCTINGQAAVGALIGIMNESTGVRKIENCTVTNNTIVQTGSFGGDYDNMFGVVVGLINIDNSTIHFNNCEFANNTLKGVASELLYGVDEGNTIFVDGIEQVKVSNQNALDSAVSSGNVDVTLAAGEYKMPSSGTTGEVNISGTKETVLDMTMGAYMEGATVTIEGVTIKTSTGMANGNGADYAALYTPNVTYKNCTFVGPMRVGRDGAKFINCTFTELGNDYVWTYGNDVTFENCTFNTDGKAVLIYSDGGNEVSQVSVKNCVFNSTQGAKAGAIANQNCAAIEIHNYGNGVNLTTEGNTYNSNFSGEWRIKTYETGRTQIFVNGTEYTTIAIDGKIMTIDANKNVTVQ